MSLLVFVMMILVLLGAILLTSTLNTFQYFLSIQYSDDDENDDDDTDDRKYRSTILVPWYFSGRRGLVIVSIQVLIQY